MATMHERRLRDEQGRGLYSCGSDVQALPTELMSGIPLMLMRAGLRRGRGRAMGRGSDRV